MAERNVQNGVQKPKDGWQKVLKHRVVLESGKAYGLKALPRLLTLTAPEVLRGLGEAILRCTESLLASLNDSDNRRKLPQTVKRDNQTPLAKMRGLTASYAKRIDPSKTKN